MYKFRQAKLNEVRVLTNQNKTLLTFVYFEYCLFIFYRCYEMNYLKCLANLFRVIDTDIVSLCQHDMFCLCFANTTIIDCSDQDTVYYSCKVRVYFIYHFNFK